MRNPFGGCGSPEGLAFELDAWLNLAPMSWRTLRIAFVCGVIAAAAVPACGGSSSNPNPSSSGNGGSSGSAGKGGRAGAAGSAPTMPVTCGSKTCKDVLIPQVDFTIPACCADAATNHCGIDSSVLATFGPTFPDACQPLDQPGTLDATCPASPETPLAGTPLTIKFPGCCRPDHTCGYRLDSIGGLIPLGLGCVDSAPFLDGAAPQACGDLGSGGNGNAGTAGEAGANASGAGGESGAPSGGAAGDSAGGVAGQ